MTSPGVTTYLLSAFALIAIAFVHAPSASAQVEYNAELRKNQNDCNAYYARARRYADHDEAEQAVKYFEAAQRLGPKGFCPQDCCTIVEAYLRLGRTKDGMALLDKNIAKYHCYEAYGLRAAQYRKLNQDDKALADLNAAIMVAPGYRLGLLQRAKIYTDRKQYAKAIADYTTVLALCKENKVTATDFGSAIKGRADCYGKLGRFDLQKADLATQNSSAQDWAKEMF